MASFKLQYRIVVRVDGQISGETKSKTLEAAKRNLKRWSLKTWQRLYPAAKSITCTLERRNENGDWVEIV